jgi:hypothetical protein
MPLHIRSLNSDELLGLNSKLVQANVRLSGTDLKDSNKAMGGLNSQEAEPPGQLALQKVLPTAIGQEYGGSTVDSCAEAYPPKPIAIITKRIMSTMEL